MAITENVKYEYELFAELASPIIELIDDIDITEVYVDSYDRISYMKGGTIHETDIRFEDRQSLVNLCEHLTKDLKTTTKQTDNYFSLNSSEGHRFTLYIPEGRMSFDKFSITIRLFRALEMDYMRMIELGAFTENQFNIMIDYMKRGKNLLICGKPNSGKTTIMRCILKSLIDDIKPRIIFLEDPKELNLDYDKGFEIEVNHKQKNSASDALRFCLRNSPQIMVLGEILDPDVARTFIESVEAGFSGAISTIHANNALVATSRLATLAAKGSNVTRSDWLETANETIDLVAYVDFDQMNGTRRLKDLYDVKKEELITD